MKKLLLVLAIGAFAACNSGTGDTTNSDSMAGDTSNTMVAPAPDTTSMMNSDTMSHMGDTSKMMTDTTTKM